ncbi:hypothetical protein SVIOM74S_04137 [Streptomyces violarus]
MHRRALRRDLQVLAAGLGGTLPDTEEAVA